LENKDPSRIKRFYPLITQRETIKRANSTTAIVNKPETATPQKSNRATRRWAAEWKSVMR
jgi:hypothetical protein